MKSNSKMMLKGALDMSQMFSFSKHAREKMKERGIGIEDLRRVFESPMFRFYDVVSRAEVIMGECTLYNIKIFLTVIFRRRDDSLHIITVYPVRDVEEEVRRKVKSGRWIQI